MMPRLRRLACRLLRPWGLRRLARITAQGFGLPRPRLRARGHAGRLAQYAAFCREAALRRLQRGQPVDASLYAAALRLGQGLRRLLGVGTTAGALDACRLLYAQIGIDLRIDNRGGVVVERCFFSEFYEPAVCRVISALDRGLVAGLTGGGELAFRTRITEGAAACTGSVAGLPCAAEGMS